MTDRIKAIQRWAGVPDDGIWGPVTEAAVYAKALGKPRFDRAAFLARYVNTNAPAITDADIVTAAVTLGVPASHIRMVRKVESAGKSFDRKGRPTILFEPHKFWQRTSGAYGVTSFSYPRRGMKPYPDTYDERWAQMADAAECDEDAALCSASWGLFQVMGFNWKSLGYASVQDFAAKMTASEANHLDACVRYIKANKLQGVLAECRAGDPESCRAFALMYNGAAYAENNYHKKMAEALV